MPDELREIACLFRAAAGQLRRLSTGPIRTKRDTIEAASSTSAVTASAPISTRAPFESDERTNPNTE
jgi:hypothetical protein